MQSIDDSHKKQDMLHLGVHAFKACLIIAAALMLGACSINNVGFLACETIKAERGWVVTTYRLGPSIEINHSQGQANLGLDKKSSLLAESEDLTPGWRFGYAPSPERKPILVEDTTLGFRYSQSRLDNAALSIGMRQAVELIKIEPEKSAYIEIRYDAVHPEKSYLHACLEIEKCINQKNW